MIIRYCIFTTLTLVASSLYSAEYSNDGDYYTNYNEESGNIEVVYQRYSLMRTDDSVMQGMIPGYNTQCPCNKTDPYRRVLVEKIKAISSADNTILYLNILGGNNSEVNSSSLGEDKVKRFLEAIQQQKELLETIQTTVKPAKKQDKIFCSY